MSASFVKFELIQAQVKYKDLRYLASDLDLKIHCSVDKYCNDSNGLAMVLQVNSLCFHYCQFVGSSFVPFRKSVGAMEFLLSASFCFLLVLRHQKGKLDYPKYSHLLSQLACQCAYSWVRFIE